MFSHNCDIDECKKLGGNHNNYNYGLIIPYLRGDINKSKHKNFIIHFSGHS